MDMNQVIFAFKKDMKRVCLTIFIRITIVLFSLENFNAFMIISSNAAFNNHISALINLELKLGLASLSFIP